MSAPEARDADRAPPKPRPAAAADAGADLNLYLKVGLPIAVVLGAAIAGAIQGPGVTMLVLGAGALVGVIAAFWTSLRTLIGETQITGADAFALAAPRAEEEQKQAVLRAIKDLEFERSVGKISDADYQALVAKYRAEAKRLLRVLEEEAGPRRARVEGLVERRLREAGLATELTGRGVDIDAEPKRDAAPDAATTEGRASSSDTGEAPASPGAGRTPKKKKKKSPEKKAETQTPSPPETPALPALQTETPEPTASASDRILCPACDTSNDADATFCKKCGAKLEAASEPERDDEREDQKAEGGA